MAQIRTTIQRSRILEYLRNTKKHPSAEEVYQHVSQEMPNITLATVYRNLNLLAAQRIIEKVKVENKWRFDGHQGNHVHAICDMCGTIIDVQQPLKKAALPTIKGFNTTGARITYTGLCTTCSRKQHTR